MRRFGIVHVGKREGANGVDDGAEVTHYNSIRSKIPSLGYFKKKMKTMRTRRSKIVRGLSASTYT